jgi:hypothetical protein
VDCSCYIDGKQLLIHYEATVLSEWVVLKTVVLTHIYHLSASTICTNTLLNPYSFC